MYGKQAQHSLLEGNIISYASSNIQAIVQAIDKWHLTHKNILRRQLRASQMICNETFIISYLFLSMYVHLLNNK